MKRTIAFLLACLMLLSLMACGKKNEEAKTAEEPVASEEAPAAESSGMTAGEEAEANGNVMTDEPELEYDSDGIARVPYNSLEELNSVLGGRLSKPVSVDAEDVVIELDASESGVQIGTYIFMISGIPCGMRFCPDFKADIGGMVDENGTSLFEGKDGDFTMEYEDTEIAHWVTVDGQYVLVVNTNELQLFEPLLEEMKILTSGAEVTQDPETGEFTVVEPD